MTATAHVTLRIRSWFSNVWVPYLAFIILANFASTEVSYLLLAFYSACMLSRNSVAVQRVSSTLSSMPLFVIVQLPLAVTGFGLKLSLLGAVSLVVAAMVEEFYFRGVLQPRLGIVPQAFAFSLAHMRLSNPVSLVESALLVPHHMLLGIAFGIVADQGGYLSSALAHAVYNLVSATYTLPFELGTVAALLALDSLLASILILQRLLCDKLNNSSIPGCTMRKRLLEWTALVLTLALLVSPAIAYVLKAWDPYWVAITNLGDEPAYVVLSILLYTLVSPELGFYALISLMTSGWVNVLLKNVFALPRPPQELWKIEVSGYGFPSGHAQTSTTFWSSIALKLREYYAVLLGAVIIALVAFSRLELNVHYFHDVVGGIAMGLICAFAAFWLIQVTRRWKWWKQSLFLAIYGAAVSLLYLLHPEVVYVRVGGVTMGLSAYPKVSTKLQVKKPLVARVFSATTALIVALILTRAVAAAAPLVQLIAYATVALTAVLAPLAGIPLKRARERRGELE